MRHNPKRPNQRNYEAYRKKLEDVSNESRGARRNSNKGEESLSELLPHNPESLHHPVKGLETIFNHTKNSTRIFSNLYK